MGLTTKEFAKQEKGTTATKIKIYNAFGNLVDCIYILDSNKDDEYYNDLEQAQMVANGHYTDTVNVIRN